LLEIQLSKSIKKIQENSQILVLFKGLIPNIAILGDLIFYYCLYLFFIDGSQGIQAQ
jgi:hypothetical protein